MVTAVCTRCGGVGTAPAGATDVVHDDIAVCEARLGQSLPPAASSQQDGVTEFWDRHVGHWFSPLGLLVRVPAVLLFASTAYMFLLWLGGGLASGDWTPPW